MEEKTSKVRTGTVNCMIAALIICLIAEAIGPLEFQVMGIDVRIMTMIWAIIIGILLSPHLLGKVIPALQKVISKPEIERSPFLLSMVLYPLGIMFGISAGPQIGVVFEAGLALVLQEFGNMGTMLIALPLAIFMGLGKALLVQPSPCAEIPHWVLPETNMDLIRMKVSVHWELISAAVFLVLCSIRSLHQSA